MKNNDNLNYKKKWLMLIAFCFVFLVVVVGTAFSNVNVCCFAESPVATVGRLIVNQNGVVIEKECVLNQEYDIDDFDLPSEYTGKVIIGYYLDPDCTRLFSFWTFTATNSTLTLYCKMIPNSPIAVAKKYGYLFDGWYKDRNLTVKAEAFLFMNTVYPKFTPIVFNILMRLDGRDFFSIRVNYGSNFNAHTPHGLETKSFAWLLNGRPVEKIKVRHDTVLVSNNYEKLSVTLHCDGSSDRVITGKYNSTVGLPGVPFPNDGTKYILWYENPSFEGNYLRNVILDKDITLYGKINLYIYDCNFYVDNSLYKTINIKSNAILGGVK